MKMKTKTMRQNVLATSVICVAILTVFSACDRKQEEGESKPATIVLTEEPSARPDTAATVQEAPASLADVRCPDVKVHVGRGQTLTLRTEGLTLTAVEAVRHEADYSVTSLGSEELPPMPQGMVNMTGAAAGYRLLPGGEHFLPYAELRVTYDPGRLPRGYTPDDIYTSYYDTAALAWVRLERVGVDTASREVVSLTTHFTDFVNELLKAPEMPETQAFVPTAMSDLEAASPMAGMTLMQPPTPNHMGTVELTYPLDIPAGRNGMQPDLALTYSSGGGSGWLGEGWDVPIQAIRIDTRWGVPRYDPKKESEVYQYKGEQLVTKDVEGKFRQMPHRTTLWSGRLPDGTRFYPRVDEACDSIVRHGAKPSDYWWEVYDRGGTVHRYGHYATLSNDTYQSTLRDNRGNIARWCLAESEDAYGNMVRYLYDTVQYAGITGGIVKGRQIYPAEIQYTLHRDSLGNIDDTGHHRVILFREDIDRARKYSKKVEPGGGHILPQSITPAIDCRNGFKEVTASLLSYVKVHSGDTINRKYYFGILMDGGTNYKAVLKNVSASANQDENEQLQKGVFTRGEQPGNWLNFDYVEAGTDLFGQEVCMNAGWASLGYEGDVAQTGFAGDATSVLGRCLTTTALGMTKGTSWNVGGGVGVGLGYEVFWTELAAGGNYSYSRHKDKGSLSLIDIDGDGLADRVFKDINGNIKYRRHIRVDGSRFIYGPAKAIVGIDEFQETTGSNNDLGLQVTLGVSATGSRNWGKSYTTTYFSDVNADGLPDLVTDKGVYFNDLVNGVPTFSRTPHHNDPGIVDTVRTSTMPCGYIIYDGILNDSIYCATVRVRKEKSYETQQSLDEGIMADFIDSGYVIEQIVEYTVQGYRDTLDCNSRGYHTGGGDGIGGWGIDPVMEAVKVWVAPWDGMVVVKDSIRMMPDRTGGLDRSRYADGIMYKVQWYRDVDAVADTALSCHDSVFLPELSGILSPNDTSFEAHITQMYVSEGDILMFRLQSVQSRLFDRTDWRHEIEYTNTSNDPDIYGKSPKAYRSKEDYVVSGKDYFQAPDKGELVLDIDVKTGALKSRDTHNEIIIHVQRNNDPDTSYSVPENNSCVVHAVLKGSHSFSNNVNKSDIVKIWITATTPSGQTTWGNVECRPHYRFIPMPGADIKDTLDYWVAPSIPVLETVRDSAYVNLFGPLYRGWGQFCYMSDGTSPDNPIALSALRCGKTVRAGCQDTCRMKTVGSHINAGNMSFGSLSSALTATGNYNPLSTAEGRWRRMEPDCRRQAWVGYGRTTVLTDTMAANVCPREYYATGDAAEIIDMDCPATAPTAEYPKVKTHARYSESITDNVALSIDLGVIGTGVSHSAGHSNTQTDFVDLNGDRYPDLVGEGAVQYTMPFGGLEKNVRAVLGDVSENGTESGGANVSPGDNPQTPRKMFGKVSASSMTESVPGRPVSNGANGGLATGIDTARYSLTDINGDGLPDKIFADGRASLNVGYAFLTPEPWDCDGTHRGSYISGSGSASVSFRLPFNLSKFSIGGGRSIGMSDNSTDFQLFDINGDGLPDRVEVTDDHRLSVHINMGGGRWIGTSTDIDKISHGISFNESVNASVTAGFTPFGAKVTVTLNGSPLGCSYSGERTQFMDVDGDGFIDYVTSDRQNSMTVRYNTLGRVNQLIGVHNFNGATFTMDYAFVSPTYDQPQGQWVLSSCRVIGDAGKGVPDSYTTYSYLNPHYDRYERISFGYDTVIACQHILDGPDNFVPYRYITEGYHNGCYHKRGKKRSASVKDSDGRTWDQTLYDIVAVDMENGDTAGDLDCPLVSYPLVEKTVTNHYEGHPAPRMTTAKSFIYDSYRNVQTYINWGDTNRTGDELRADISHFTGQRRNLVSLRGSVVVRGGRHPSSQIMRKSQFSYNGKGSLLSRTDYIGDTATAVTDYQYDEYGNVTLVTLPRNAASQRMWYRYTYDPVLHRLPVLAEDAYGRQSSSAFSFSLGKPISVTDVAGNTMRYTYDMFGRLLTVTAPDELSCGIPYTWMASYDAGKSATTSHYDTLHPGNPVQAVTICDPWGRIVQTKKDLEMNGNEVLQVSGKVEYDALGRTVRQYDPTTESTATPSEYNPSPTTLRAATVYDILDRSVQCSTFHNATPLVRTSSFAYTSTLSGTMMHVSVTDPLNRTTTRLVDAHGRTVSVTNAAGGTTSYTFDALGQIVQSTDPEGFATSYAYDLLGRTTQRYSPDAGQTTVAYDPVGNVIRLTNASGESVSTGYYYMRPVQRHYSRLSLNDVWYNYNSAGQVSEIRNGNEIQHLSYDALGNISSDSRSFAVPYSNETYTFSMEFTYDCWGRMLAMTYPDGEVVSYSYDHGGNLSGMTGSKNGVAYSYINGILYDCYGNRTSIEYGNLSHTSYTYDDLQRLSRMKTFAHNSGSEALIQDIEYTFDGVGNITSATCFASAFGSMGGPYANTYSYDGIDRLTGATQSYGTGNTLGMTYSPSGRLCGKVQSFSGDYAVFGYHEDVKPHAPRRRYDSSLLTLHDMLWDPSGNLAQVNQYDMTDGSLVSSRHLFWTEDNRLTNAVDDKHYSYYAYDHTGERTLKMTGANTVIDINAELITCYSFVDNVTLYASPYLVASNTGYTKHYYAGAERVCARQGNGGLDRLSDFIVSNTVLQEKSESLLMSCNNAMNGRFVQENNPSEIAAVCGGTPVELVAVVESAPVNVDVQMQVDCSSFTLAMSQFAGLTQQQEDAYFYHSDHLGSASWITDASGKPIQHLQYLPFGEPYVDQRTSGYNERFTFTGKERDEETGYGYFGARYMDHELMTGWLSVDPMADKYPSISPYTYCAWNPVKLVDPDGNEALENDDKWKVDRLNKTITRVGLDGGNNTQYVEGEGAWIRNESRGDLLNEYDGFTVIDNVQSESQLNPGEERSKSPEVPPEAVAGTIIGGTGLGCEKMAKALFDYDNGTYMGKDGSIKIMQKGKNGGVKGKYKNQIKLSANYSRSASIFKWAGRGLAVWSTVNTEMQAMNGEISTRERITNHVVDGVSLLPYCWHASLFYELGKEYGPSTWFNKD